MEEARRLEKVSVACPISSHLCVPGGGGDLSDTWKSEDEAEKWANTPSLSEITEVADLHNALCQQDQKGQKRRQQDVLQ